MAWDFETEPEFETKLEWIRQFVRDKVEPLDLVFPHRSFHPLDDETGPLVRPMQDEVPRRGTLWARHLGPELGGKGFGQLKLALMNEILGTLAVGTDRVRHRRAGHRQRRDHRPLRHRGAEGAVPAAAAQR